MSEGKRSENRGWDIWDDVLQDANRLFLDTAPLIYYVEKHPVYAKPLKPLFDRIDRGQAIAFTSPITLAECLVHPYRLHLNSLQKDFSELIVGGRNTVFVPIDHNIAERAAAIRSNHHLSLADAFQVATAIFSDCDAIVSNDAEMKKVQEIKIIVLSEMIKK